MDTEHSVTREQAAREMGISLRTLDRKIADGSVKVRRVGRRVGVLLDGPAPPTTEEMLTRLRAELAHSEASRTALSLEVRRSKGAMDSAVNRALHEQRENLDTYALRREQATARHLYAAECTLREVRRQRDLLLWPLAALDAIGVALVTVYVVSL